MNDEFSVVDDKSSIRDRLDLRSARWRRVRPRGADPHEATVEFAFVTDGESTTYVAMRQTYEPDGTVLVFTPSEWDAFLSGARDGEFDHPATPRHPHRDGRPPGAGSRGTTAPA